MRLAFLLINTQGFELQHHWHRCFFYIFDMSLTPKELYTELHIMKEEEWKGVHEVTDH